MNIVSIMGRFTADPEIRKTTSGTSVCNFALAVDRYANGAKQADFINFTAFGNNADNIGKFFRKGDLVAIQGNIHTSQYQDRETGKNRTSFSVWVDRFDFCQNKKQEEQPMYRDSNYQQPARSANIEYEGFSQVADNDGDLPF